jgi:imidazole glycerol-phosphate synthase subunit HisH
MSVAKKTVALIDYGMGNLHSAAKSLQLVAPEGTDVIVTCDADVILKADHVVLPGVGAIRDCMAEIINQGVDKVVAQVIQQGTPFLGICVGMQALMSFSEENGGVKCLSEFDAKVKHFDKTMKDQDGNALKVPHMGWNNVKQHTDHPVWDGIEDNAYFYFVHSYFVEPARDGKEDYSAGLCNYGHDFTAAVAHKNVFATQFHPEKSHDNGLKLLGNFLRWDGK